MAAQPHEHQALLAVKLALGVATPRDIEQLRELHASDQDQRAA